ncbi:MAG: S1C family serine protease [Opitutales bacterium]
MLAASLLSTPLHALEEETREDIRVAVEAAREAAREAQEIAREAAREWSWTWRNEERSTTRGPEPYIGVTIEAVPRALRRYIDLPDGVGLLLVKIHKDSPAMRAGLQEDDILYRFDDQLIVNFSQFSTLVDLHAAGDVVPVTVLRKGGEVEVELTIEEREQRGGRWPVPPPPAPPPAPAVDGVGELSPRPPAPPAPGRVEERVVYSDEQTTAIITDHLPGHIRIVTDGANDIDIDLTDLKSNLGELESRLRRLDLEELKQLEGVQSLEQLRTIIFRSAEAGPRESIVHMGGTHVVFSDETGRVALSFEDDQRMVLVTTPDGAVIYDGAVPADLSASDLDPRAKALIEKLLETTGEIDLELSEDPDMPVEIEVDEAEQHSGI